MTSQCYLFTLGDAVVSLSGGAVDVWTQFDGVIQRSGCQFVFESRWVVWTAKLVQCFAFEVPRIYVLCRDRTSSHHYAFFYFDLETKQCILQLEFMLPQDASPYGTHLSAGPTVFIPCASEYVTVTATCPTSLTESFEHSMEVSISPFLWPPSDFRVVYCGEPWAVTPSHPSCKHNGVFALLALHSRGESWEWKCISFWKHKFLPPFLPPFKLAKTATSLAIVQSSPCLLAIGTSENEVVLCNASGVCRTVSVGGLPSEMRVLDETHIFLSYSSTSTGALFDVKTAQVAEEISWCFSVSVGHPFGSQSKMALVLNTASPTAPPKFSQHSSLVCFFGENITRAQAAGAEGSEPVAHRCRQRSEAFSSVVSSLERRLVAGDSDLEQKQLLIKQQHSLVNYSHTLLRNLSIRDTSTECSCQQALFPLAVGARYKPPTNSTNASLITVLQRTNEQWHGHGQWETASHTHQTNPFSITARHSMSPSLTATSVHVRVCGPHEILVSACVANAGTCPATRVSLLLTSGSSCSSPQTSTSLCPVLDVGASHALVGVHALSRSLSHEGVELEVWASFFAENRHYFSFLGVESVSLAQLLAPSPPLVVHDIPDSLLHKLSLLLQQECEPLLSPSLVIESIAPSLGLSLHTANPDTLTYQLASSAATSSSQFMSLSITFSGRGGSCRAELGAVCHSNLELMLCVLTKCLPGTLILPDCATPNHTETLSKLATELRECLKDTKLEIESERRDLDNHSSRRSTKSDLDGLGLRLSLLQAASCPLCMGAT